MNKEKLLEHARSFPPLRGTRAWDNRELARQMLGNRCLSFGSIDEALERQNRTLLKSSLQRLAPNE